MTFPGEENMKLRILSLLFILIVSGCAPALSTPGPATPTPNIMPRLDPSPTPSGSTLPLTCQVTDLNVHIDETNGYCFAYPNRFTMGTNPMLNTPAIVGPALEGLDPVYASFSVEVVPADMEHTARGEAEIFLENFTVVDVDSLTWNQVMIDGEWGWMVEPVPAMGSWRFVFVQHNGYLYRLSYWPVDIDAVRADVDELAQVTMASFAFTK